MGRALPASPGDPMPGVFGSVADGDNGHDLLDGEHRLVRKVRFALVGGACFALQLTILRVLRDTTLARSQANAIGFALSAQANYALSTVFTWRDRSGYGGSLPVVSQRDIDANGRSDTRGASWAGAPSLPRWATYNLTALVALGVNTATFVAVDDTAGEVPAALAGVAAGRNVNRNGLRSPRA